MEIFRIYIKLNNHFKITFNCRKNIKIYSYFNYKNLIIKHMNHLEIRQVILIIQFKIWKKKLIVPIIIN